MNSLRQENSTTPAAARLSDALQAAILQTQGEAATKAPLQWDAFLDAVTLGEALRCWLGEFGDLSRQDICRRLNRDVALIDQLLGEQLDAVLHHPRFQQLEASWRGLDYLVDHATGNVKIRVLDVTWKQLVQDLERALEFDQSQLFKKVYSEEFGMPGGEPYGLLLGDYTIHHRPGPGHPFDDLAALTAISKVAAAAFAPFVATAAPQMLGMESFAELSRVLRLAETAQQPEFLKWRTLRDTEDSRFVALTLPQTLMRLPYRNDGGHAFGFVYEEDVSGRDAEKLLWGSASYAFGAVVARAFAETGWLADIRGVEPGVAGGGVVTGLPLAAFRADTRSVGHLRSTEVIVTDRMEKDLGDLGFISLCACHDTDLLAFYGAQSIHRPEVFDEPGATANARLSSTLQYMLCVSRFAHYVKVIGRDRVGSFARAEELEKYLFDWLLQYAVASDEAAEETKARFPLREVKVEIRDLPGKPGCYSSVIHLRPHYQLEQLTASMRLVTELSSPQSSRTS